MAKSARTCAKPSARAAAATPVIWKSKLRKIKQLSTWRRSCRDGRTKPSSASSAKQLRAEPEPKCVEPTRAPAAAETAKRKKTASSADKPLSSMKRVEACAESTELLQKRRRPDPAAMVLAINAALLRRRGAAVQPKMVAPLEKNKECDEESHPVKPKLGVTQEIKRILAAQSPEEVLNLVGSDCSEGNVSVAWKKLVLILHPDKLQRLDEETCEAGAQALHFVHEAKEEMRRRTQEAGAEVPEQPQAASAPRCLEGVSGSRKIEIRWKTPESQDPKRPVEKYEIWGPRYFSEAGEPYDWTMLASLPPLQSHFVLVEEAPTQQDVMWAADRVLRPTLPLTLHAVNGKGPSEALTFEMTWASEYPWLQGDPSVLCPRCCQLSHRRGAFSRCGGCGFNIPAENALVIRCPECQGEVLWSQRGSQLACSCCFKKFGGASAQDQFKQPKPPSRPPPGYHAGAQRQVYTQSSGNRHNRYGGRSGGNRW